MSKKSLIIRNEKRKKLAAKYAKKRLALKMIVKSPKSSAEEIFAAQMKLQKLPNNSYPVRIMNRCEVTGRARSYYRRFGVSRMVFRQLALIGEVPGVTKSSW